MGVSLCFSLELKYYIWFVGIAGLFQNGPKDFALNIRCELLFVVVAILQAIVERCIGAGYHEDGLEPALREEITAMVFNDVAALGHDGFQVVHQLNSTIELFKC